MNRELSHAATTGLQEAAVRTAGADGFNPDPAIEEFRQDEQDLQD